MSLKNRSIFPDTVTSYDVWKTAALILMIVDHIGFYFFPDAYWWRAVGRMSAPIWLFLLGYARSRDIPPKLWGGGGFLVLFSFVIGPTLFPTNILINMVLIRISLDWVVQRYLDNKKHWMEGLVIILALILPTNVLTDYGIIGMVVALMGYISRHLYDTHKRENKITVKEKKYSPEFLTYFTFFAAGLYIMWPAFTFGFNVPQNIFMTIAVSFVFYKLQYFRPLSNVSDSLSQIPVISHVLKFGGRWTLEIYIVHIIIFKIIAHMMGYPSMELFEWRWL